jgi:hypothetical protein
VGDLEVLARLDDERPHVGAGAPITTSNRSAIPAAASTSGQLRAGGDHANTLDTDRHGETAGMLSVNAATGAVWYHGWHGTFLSERKF